MNKLDHLLLLVDSLEAKAETLVSALQESTLLMENICKNTDDVSTYDLNIESVNETIRSNYDYHLRFIEMVGKTDLFESSIAHNDCITNNHLLSNLEAESRFLIQKYTRVGTLHVAVAAAALQKKSGAEAAAPEPDLSRSASIASMNLKPIRCKSTQVSKKKSRYRISKVFNINPLSYDDNSSEVSHTAVNTTFDETIDAVVPESQQKAHDNSAHESNPSDSTFFDHSDDKLSLLNPIEYSIDDNESILSDVSTTPPKYTSIENFENFLRKSRVNLNSSSYPFAIKKSVSEESLVPQKISIPPITNHKFHNPIDNIKQSAAESITPTIEAIYSSSNKVDNNSKKLLSDVINSSSKPPQFSLFNFALISPEKPRRAAEAPPQLERRKSIIGKSLTESFLMLMNHDLQPPPPPSHDRTSAVKRRKSDKLERLKSVPKTKPISIQSDNYLKRVPVAQGSHSSITIDSNKSFVVSHGRSSLFNKPVVTSFSNRSLQEAMNTSISF